MASLDTWFDEAMPELPGSGREALLQTSRRVFREFCTTSAAYVLEHEQPIDIVDAQVEYDVLDAYPSIVTDDILQPLFIHTLGYFPDFAVDPHHTIPLNPLQAPEYRLGSTVPTEQPWGYKTFIEKPGIFELVPTVSRDIPQAISTFVSFRMKTGASFPDDAIPDVFEHYWFDVILSGIIGYMTAQIDKPYTSPTKTKLHQQRFRKGMSTAREMAQRQFNTSEFAFAFPTAGGWIRR